jgi:hypothetical protein
MSKEEALVKLEKEITHLKEELEVCKEAKPASEACNALFDFIEKEEEPFSTSSVEANPWHKSAGGGGGCTIL